MTLPTFVYEIARSLVSCARVFDIRDFQFQFPTCDGAKLHVDRCYLFLQSSHFLSIIVNE